MPATTHVRIDRRRRPLCAAILAPALWSAALGAAGADTDLLVSEYDLLMDLPVVLTATRLRQPVADAPAAVTIIDRELIDASGVREIADILRLVPGMLVARHTNDEPMIAYGGIGERYSRRMQVLVDGRSVYQPFSGGVLWPDLGLAIEDIAHIEVIRGPNAAAYGPNSFQGVINIITKHPAETRGRHVTTRVGTHGVRDLTARQSSGSPNMDYRLTLATQHDDGFPDEASRKRTGFADLRADYRLTGHHTLTTQLGIGQSRKSRGLQSDPVNPPRRFATDAGHLQFRLEEDAGTGDSWSLQYYYQQHLVKDTFDVDFLGTPVRLDDDVRTDRHDVELEQRLQLAPGTRVVWGAGLRHDRVASPAYFGDQSPVTDDLSRVFANIEQRLTPAATLNLGGMYEDSRLVGGQFSPRAALSLRPHEAHTFRLIASRATRTPVLTEELGFHSYPDPGFFGGEPVVLIDSEGGLDPETIESYEIGHHASFPERGLTLDTRLFDNTVRNLIAGARREETNVLGDTLRTFRNRGGMRYQGLEMQLDYRLTPRTRLHGGFTHHFGRRGRSEQDDGRYAEAIPRNIVTAAVSSRVSEALTISGTYYHYSKINWIDGAPSDAYDGFLDLSARWDLRRNMHFGLTVQDVLARGYDARTPDNSDIYQVNRRETRSFATLAVDF